MYEVFALHLGWREISRSLVLNMDDTGHTVLYYYMWVIKGNGRCFLVDTGFEVSEAGRRGVQGIVDPRQALAKLGINHETVSDVIVSHLHWDHFGGWGYFPKANFHIQTRELDFLSVNNTFRNERVNRFYTGVEKIEYLLKEGRVKAVNNEAALSDGINVFWVGGHTPGCQAIEVRLKNRRQAILAVDGSFFFENYEKRIPPLLNLNTIEAIQAYDIFDKRLDREQGVLIPGHDPAVIEKYESREGVIHINRTNRSGG